MLYLDLLRSYVEAVKPFEILDISGDVGLRIIGKSRDDLFLNASAGIYSLITNLDDVNPIETRVIRAEGDSHEGLLVAWLNELIFYFDAHGFIGKVIKIRGIDRAHIEAEVTGDIFDAEKHERGLLVKAATYHNLKMEQQDGVWMAEVIFDI